MGLNIFYSDFSPIFPVPDTAQLIRNRTGNPSLLSLWTVSAQQAPLPFPNKIRNLSAQTVSAKQDPLPGQVAVTQDCYTQSWSCES